MSLRARIHSKKDVATGALFVAIGLMTTAGAADYPLGTIRNIGPGYFPIMLGIVLTLLGAGIASQGLSFGETTDGPPEDAHDDEGFAIRPLVMITLAVVAFGLLVRPLGLAAAVVALVAVSSLAGRDFSIVRVAVLCAALIVLSWLIFIYLLGLPMTVWPR